MGKQALGVGRVARLLRVSQGTLYRLAAAAQLPGRKVGGAWRSSSDAIKRYASRELEPATTRRRGRGQSETLEQPVAERTEEVKANERLKGGEERFRRHFESAPDAMLMVNKQGEIALLNTQAELLFGYLREELLGQPLEILIPAHLRRRHPGLCEGYFASAPERPTGTMEACVRRKDGSEFLAEISLSFLEMGEEPLVLSTVRDLTDRKQAEEALRAVRIIESIDEARKESTSPSYGELTEPNTCRIVLRAVGQETLRDIAGECLSLLATSAAVYEANGDYALGIFSSGWCRFLDEASRSLCETDDNREALESGKWHCHESCWECSKKAMETRQAVDLECNGGIRLYAVPILADDEVVGAMNFGYGDPPTDSAKLQELSERYCVSPEELRQYAQEYDPRPPFVVTNAKKRLRAAANLLGEIVKRKHAEERLRESEERLRSLLGNVPAFVVMVGPDAKILYVNRLQPGFTLDQVIGTEIYDHLLPDDRQILKGAFQRAVQTGEAATCEIRATGAHGQMCWYSNHLGPIKTNDRASGITMIITDITERKQAEEDLRRAEQAREQEGHIAAALGRVGHELIAALGSSRLLDRLCEVAAEVLECELSHTLLRHPDEDVYVVVAGYGGTPQENETAQLIKVPTQAMSELFARLEADDVAQVGTIPTEVLSEARQRELATSLQLCIALRSGQEIIGIQAVGSRRHVEPFTSQQWGIARGIAQLASLVLAHARGVDELERAHHLNPTSSPPYRTSCAPRST